MVRADRRGGRLDLSNLDELINEKTKIVSFTLVSNLMGTVNPVEAIVRRAQAVGALVLIDASQAAPHMVLDVQALEADFVAFTGHKMLAPTGIGVLWGRQELLEDLPPFLGGGEMIETVTMGSSTYAPAPHKFEAGTPPIAQAVGLGAAIDYLSAIGMERIAAHEHAITEYAVERLLEIPDLRIIGPRSAVDRGAAISFVLGDIHPHDVGQVLDEQGIAVRVGHHCARPVCLRYGIPATTRASFYLYSTAGRRRRPRRRPAPRPELLRLRHRKGAAGMKLDSMYQEIILDHYRNPHGKGLRDGDAEVHHVNPTCGDEITLRVRLDGSTVADISYESQGCSISQASASVLNDLVVGKTVGEGQLIQEAFLELMQSKGQGEGDEEVLEDAVAFVGVSKYPARVKCALLSWMAWKDATAQALAQHPAVND